MSEEICRRTGAILGLALGFVLMTMLGYSGLIPGALFGAGGCVAGSITAEKFYAWNKSKGG